MSELARKSEWDDRTESRAYYEGHPQSFLQNWGGVFIFLGVIFLIVSAIKYSLAGVLFCVILIVAVMGAMAVEQRQDERVHNEQLAPEEIEA